eukprot:711307_1
MSNHSTTNKRSREQNGESNVFDSEPLVKKRKIHDESARMLFSYDACHMDIQKTKEEMNDIPDYWNVCVESNQIQHQDIDEYKAREYFRNRERGRAPRNPMEKSLRLTLWN